MFHDKMFYVYMCLCHLSIFMTEKATFTFWIEVKLFDIH